MNNIIYNWKFSDDKDRTKTWYIVAISLVLWLSIWGILTRQYFFAFIVILIAGITFFIENNSPDFIEVELEEDWIRINELSEDEANTWNSFYNYSQISSFCFVYEKEKPILLRLMINKKWIKKLDLKINNEIMKDLKEILPNFLAEGEVVELSAWEKLISLLKL